MASSSTTSRIEGVESLDLRYTITFCSCGKKTLIKIVESQVKPSKGKLTFVCRDGVCGFQVWCAPSLVKGTFTKTRSDEGGSTQKVCTTINSRIEILEAKHEMLKLVVIGGFVVYFILLYVFYDSKS